MPLKRKADPSSPKSKKNPTIKKTIAKQNASTLASQQQEIISLADVFKCKTLYGKSTIFKTLHIKESRKKSAKVYSAAIAHHTTVARIVTFGLINCQKAKSVITPNEIVIAKWNGATFDPQESQYIARQPENWQIMLHESALLARMKSHNFPSPLPQYQKAIKSKRRIL